MKINVLHLCAWRMAIFKLDVVAIIGASVFYEHNLLATVL